MAQFKERLTVGNAVERLVVAHGSGLSALEEAAMTYFEENAVAFQVRILRATCWRLCAV